MKNGNLESKLIVGSIRKPSDVLEAVVAGAHIITIPHKILMHMPFHSKAEETIKDFDDAWKKFKELQLVQEAPQYA